jgi:alkanesulfonate monooxygenase SsuD/methylene tetrahydromethanopterin reductase-like flavin-dependent oxidoreductase (luciferase family)
MGSRADNFYNNAFARQGFGDDVAEVQRLWAEGHREAAAARVPIEIGLGTNLIGPPDLVRDRLRAYRDCGVTTLRVNPITSDLRECIAVLGMLVDLVNDVNGRTERDAVP